MADRVEVKYLGRNLIGGQVSGPTGRLYQVQPDGALHLVNGGKVSSRPGVVEADAGEFRQFPLLFKVMGAPPAPPPPPPKIVVEELPPDDQSEEVPVADDEDELDGELDPPAQAHASSATLPRPSATKDAWLKFAADNDIAVDLVEQEGPKKQLIAIITQRFEALQQG